MFIAMGVVTIGIGILTFFVLPDTPMEASWLKDGNASFGGPRSGEPCGILRFG